MRKKVCLICLVLIFILSNTAIASVKRDSVTLLGAISAKTMKQKFEELKKIYPEGSYWNDAYRVNGQEMSWECMGWAETVCDYLFGENPRNWVQQTNWNNMCVGDHVRYKIGHSIVITNISADGNTITYADCNWNYDGIVHWNKTISKTDLISKSSWFKSQYDNWVKTLDNIQTDKPADLGTDFCAIILHKASWKPISLDSDNYVRLRTETGIPEQVWRFNRNSDGSYTITSSQNGNVLDIEYAKDEDGLLVHTWEDVNGNNQRFFIYEQSNGYILRPRHSNTRVLDLCNNNSSDGTDLTLYTRNDTAAQIFAIYKIGNPKLNVTVGNSAQKTTFTWDKFYAAKSYDFKI